MKMRTYECEGVGGCKSTCILTTSNQLNLPCVHPCMYYKQSADFREVDYEKENQDGKPN